MNALKLLLRPKGAMAVGAIAICVAACLLSTIAVRGNTVPGRPLSAAEMGAVFADADDSCGLELDCYQRPTKVDNVGNTCEYHYCGQYEPTSICCECGCQPSEYWCEYWEDPMFESACTSGGDWYVDIYDPGEKDCHNVCPEINLCGLCDCDGTFDSNSWVGNCIWTSYDAYYGPDDCPCEYEHTETCYYCP
jgi:hypothetical protein